ncbi:hypothetical protein L484_006003 [Morus notabilis]|uniref:Uncharacterized protein n=1 Tax=Morus notabilis TaxID=981085 RepID=W9RSP6_9ROSA|nr:hypothetical protein L484_006003 [Morus notabilis]
MVFCLKKNEGMRDPNDEIRVWRTDLKLTRTILEPPGSLTVKKLRTELFTRELRLVKRGMQPDATYVNLTESETTKFAISLMTDSDSNNSSEVSSHMPADERQVSKKKIPGREMVAVICFPNKGRSNVLTSNSTPGSHGPSTRAPDADSSDTRSTNTNHQNITKHSSIDTSCSEVATPDTGRSYVMPPKPAIIFARVG